MSNIVSINGYRVQYHGGEPMIQDLELAKRLGYARGAGIRDLIKSMLKSGKLSENNVLRAAGKTSENGGRPGEVFWLTEFACLKVATQSETEKADEITNEVIHVFIDARKGKVARAVDPEIASHRKAVAIGRSYLSLGKMFGTDVAMSRAIAAERIKAVTGVDVTPLLANNSVAEAPVTPTELGKAVGMSGKAMNAALADQGYQVKGEDDQWHATDKAKGFCTVNPYKAPHSDHTGYRIMWYRSVLKALNLVAA